MILGRRKKNKSDGDAAPPAAGREKKRLERAEEDYLKRLSDSIRQGDPYVRRPPTPPPEASSPFLVPPAAPQPQSPAQAFAREVSAPPRAVSAPGRPTPNPIRPAVPNGKPDALTPSPSGPAMQEILSELEGIPQASLEKVIRPVAPPTPPPAPRAPATPPPKAVVSAPKEQDASFETGAILSLEDGTIGIYKQPVKGKEYEIVYMLRPSGRAVPEGIALYAYKIEQIGTLPPDILDRIARTLRWERDAIVYHLNSFDLASRIPIGRQDSDSDTTPPWAQVSAGPPILDAPRNHSRGAAGGMGGAAVPPAAGSPSASSPSQPRAYANGSSAPLGSARANGYASASSASASVAPRANANGSSAPQMNGTNGDGQLVRGRRLRVSFGPGKSWEAIYWGRDLLGAILAHRTHAQWSLMHLDLDRFKDSLDYGEILNSDDIAAIQREILTSQESA